MEEMKTFRLNFVKQEKHLLLPTVTSIIVAQNLYEILFQYVITPEKEQSLQKFIHLLETHIKSKPKAPFSVPLPELEFLDEGLQELKLLNWMEVPVSVFEISLDTDENNYESELEKTLEFLQNFMTLNRKKDSNHIYVYPVGLPKH
ncbi:MAG: hypothetical protein H5T98_00450 [Syntrophomonadaceae bacterium]|nr:hypothetical protein [Syntrophomonadaceae bacterium]